MRLPQGNPVSLRMGKITKRGQILGMLYLWGPDVAYYGGFVQFRVVKPFGDLRLVTS